MVVGDIHKMVSGYNMKIKKNLKIGLMLHESAHDMNGPPVIYTMQMNSSNSYVDNCIYFKIHL